MERTPSVPFGRPRASETTKRVRSDVAKVTSKNEPLTAHRLTIRLISFPVLLEGGAAGCVVDGDGEVVIPPARKFDAGPE